jgi:hypothetical protein
VEFLLIYSLNAAVWAVPMLELAVPPHCPANEASKLFSICFHWLSIILQTSIYRRLIVSS